MDPNTSLQKHFHTVITQSHRHTRARTLNQPARTPSCMRASLHSRRTHVVRIQFTPFFRPPKFCTLCGCNTHIHTHTHILIQTGRTRMAASTPFVIASHPGKALGMLLLLLLSVAAAVATTAAAAAIVWRSEFRLLARTRSQCPEPFVCRCMRFMNCVRALFYTLRSR